MGDFHPHGCSGIKIDPDVTPGVDDGAGCCATKKVGTVGQARDKELLDEHGFILLWFIFLKVRTEVFYGF
jgi:hypothetical protein